MGGENVTSRRRLLFSTLLLVSTADPGSCTIETFEDCCLFETSAAVLERVST